MSKSMKKRLAVQRGDVPPTPDGGVPATSEGRALRDEQFCAAAPAESEAPQVKEVTPEGRIVYDAQSVIESPEARKHLASFGCWGARPRWLSPSLAESAQEECGDRTTVFPAAESEAGSDHYYAAHDSRGDVRIFENGVGALTWDDVARLMNAAERWENEARGWRAASLIEARRNRAENERIEAAGPDGSARCAVCGWTRDDHGHPNHVGVCTGFREAAGEVPRAGE